VNLLYSVVRLGQGVGHLDLQSRYGLG